jgi:hypothetical protein
MCSPCNLITWISKVNLYYSVGSRGTKDSVGSRGTKVSVPRKFFFFLKNKDHLAGVGVKMATKVVLQTRKGYKIALATITSNI